MEESPDGQEPEGGSGKGDASVEFYEEVDDDEEGEAVEEELVVSLIERHECGDGHEGDDEESERAWDWWYWFFVLRHRCHGTRFGGVGELL